MKSITLEDLILINNLSKRRYTGNTFLSNGSEDERKHLRDITTKLSSIAHYFQQKYNQVYGPFEASVSTGNPIAIGGTNFKRVWSGIFKGNINKQYAAQISFVMNPHETCLDVGFYFGRASGHNVKDRRIELENQLKFLGYSLATSIQQNHIISERYDELFDKGFKAISNDLTLLPSDWKAVIRENPKSSQIIVKIFPKFDNIELSDIDYYISEIIFLMGAINNDTPPNQTNIQPLSPDQWAKRAERLAQIGLKGELYILKLEEERLKISGLLRNNYPKHVALESMHYGYDVLSLDDNGDDIFIEVKTTTRSKNDPVSRKFFLSTNEYNVYLNNKNKYKLYRIYDIENNPELEILCLEDFQLQPDGYFITY